MLLSPQTTAPRAGRGRGRADADNFWDTVPRQILSAFHPQPPATAAPPPISVEACVSVLQALRRSETFILNQTEMRVREAALERLVPLLEMPRNQRPRLRSPAPDTTDAAAARGENDDD
jgi:hypothetical protein